jgi:hypothetical protein
VYFLFGCTPGLSHSPKEKSPKVYDQENEGATQLVSLFLSNDLGNSCSVTDNVSKMNRCTIQLKNKAAVVVVVVVELQKNRTYQHV